MILTHKKINEIIEGEDWKDWRINKEGFTNIEIHIILNKFEGINNERVHSAMFGNTCMMINNQMINYPWDVAVALRCGIEDRELTVEEWD